MDRLFLNFAPAYAQSADDTPNPSTSPLLELDDDAFAFVLALDDDAFAFTLEVDAELGVCLILVAPNANGSGCYVNENQNCNRCRETDCTSTFTVSGTNAYFMAFFLWKRD